MFVRVESTPGVYSKLVLTNHWLQSSCLESMIGLNQLGVDDWRRLHSPKLLHKIWATNDRKRWNSWTDLPNRINTLPKMRERAKVFVWGGADVWMNCTHDRRNHQRSESASGYLILVLSEVKFDGDKKILIQWTPVIMPSDIVPTLTHMWGGPN